MNFIRVLSENFPIFGDILLLLRYYLKLCKTGLTYACYKFKYRKMFTVDNIQRQMANKPIPACPLKKTFYIIISVILRHHNILLNHINHFTSSYQSVYTITSIILHHHLF